MYQASTNGSGCLGCRTQMGDAPQLTQYNISQDAIRAVMQQVQSQTASAVEEIEQSSETQAPVQSSGLPGYVWVLGSLAVLGGLGTGGYFLWKKLRG